MRINKITGQINQIINFVRKNKKKKFLSLHEPLIRTEDINFVRSCMRTTFVSSKSKFTTEFEKSLKKFTNSKYVIATNNGTAALQVALLASGIKRNQEVLIPSLNYIASSNAALYCQLIPHYIDVESESLGPDVKKLEVYLNEIVKFQNNKTINKKTNREIAAIIPTHIFGNSCHLDDIVRIAKKFKLKLIEDASEALGSYYKNRHLGTIGDVGVLSFNGNKIITTGGGGAILTNNKKIYNSALKLTTISRKSFTWDYDYDGIGFNYRLPGINSSLGLSQLKKIKKILNLKNRIYKKYLTIIKKNKFLKIIKPLEHTKSNNWLICVQVKGLNLRSRNQIINKLNKRKIGVRPVWKLMHKIKHLSKYPRMKLTKSIELEKSLINLPSSPDL